jgi:hypothetical protein
VYLGLDTRTGQHVAIKQLSLERIPGGSLQVSRKQLPQCCRRYVRCRCCHTARAKCCLQSGSAATHSRQQVAATAIAVLLQPLMLVPLYLMLYVCLGGATCLQPCVHVSMRAHVSQRVDVLQAPSVAGAEQLQGAALLPCCCGGAHTHVPPPRCRCCAAAAAVRSAVGSGGAALPGCLAASHCHHHTTPSLSHVFTNCHALHPFA